MEAMDAVAMLSFFVHSPSSEGPVHPASGWVAAWSGLLILFILGSVTTFILILRHRAQNPLEGPTHLETRKPKPGGKRRREPKPPERQEDETRQPWERPADWWKD